MSNVDLARVEFAFVTINHFFFVPVTIGLAFLTALLQTTWYHSKRCTRRDSLSQPNSHSPRNVDSRKNAASPSIASGAPKMLPTSRE